MISTPWRERPVSIFSSAHHATGGTLARCSAVVDIIRSDRLRAAVEYIRECMTNNDTESANDAKKNLAAVTWSGDFAVHRTAATCAAYSGLVVIDLDHLESQDVAAHVRDLVAGHPSCAFSFLSPRGRGVKAVFLTDAESVLWHPAAYAAAKAAVLSVVPAISVDEGSDPCRLCFLSWDPGLVLSLDPVPLVIDRSAPVQAPPAPRPPGELIPPSQRHGWLVTYAARMRAVGSSADEILAAIRIAASTRLDLSDGRVFSDAELKDIAAWSGAKATGTLTVDAIAHGAEVAAGMARPLTASVPMSLAQSVQQHPLMRPYIVRDLFRKSETVNVNASPKTGKSLLIAALALAVATGTKWLSTYETIPGKVLIIDNELHPETGAARFRDVSQALGIDLEDVGDKAQVVYLRGNAIDLTGICAQLRTSPGIYDLVIVDALYRALPRDCDENANGDIMAVYNDLDGAAQAHGCAIVLVHHASKGNQSSKAITDMGSGAGAQSRAADTHVTIRRHQEPGAMVLEAVCRSSRAPAPLVLRGRYPGFVLAPDLSAEDLEGKRPQDAERADPAKAAEKAQDKLAGLLTERPMGLDRIREKARRAGVQVSRVPAFLAELAEDGRVCAWSQGRWATVPEPEGDDGAPLESQASAERQALAAFILDHPDERAVTLAERAGCSEQYVRQVRRANRLPRQKLVRFLNETKHETHAPPHTPPGETVSSPGSGGPENETVSETEAKLDQFRTSFVSDHPGEQVSATEVNLPGHRQTPPSSTTQPGTQPERP